MTSPTVGFAGMTHLGINSAAAVAAHGFRTIGYDADSATIQRLRAGDPPVTEPGLPELLGAHKERLDYTAEKTDLAACEIVYISTDVPTDDTGTSDLGGIRSLIEGIVPALAPDAILVILCQVPPGFTRGLPVPPHRLYYQVETLVFGNAVERAMKPERYIVGCADPAKPLPAAYRALLDAFGCPLLPMRYESAELAKISINCFLASSVTTSNTLAELCEQIGADWAEIAPALRLDRRIGPYAYLTPGLGIAGGNIERDLATVVRYADDHGTDADVVRAWQGNSEHRKGWAFEVLRAAVLDTIESPAIGILGLSYKENTHSVKNAPSLVLTAALRETKARVKAYDPVVRALPTLPPETIVANAAEAIAGADALVLQTPWPEFKTLDPAALAKGMAGRTVVDPFGLLDARAATAAGLDYYTLGAPPARSGKGN